MVAGGIHQPLAIAHQKAFSLQAFVEVARVIGVAPRPRGGGAVDIVAALDAAILSPSGRAVSVDGDGRLVGVADQHDLSAAIARSGTDVEPEAPSLAKEGG